MTLTPIRFPPKFQPVMTVPKRFKVLYGGRNATRSWSCARALLLKGLESEKRFLCCRETQKSITESVHQLLSDQIRLLGMGEYYDVQEARIKSRVNGTFFAFEGIRRNTEKLKSYEGIDICWVEEAVSVSKQSWLDLIPTIRKPGSEIWMTFNPRLAKDYTYQRFVLSGEESDRMLRVKMTYLDNPWANETMMEEAEACRLRDEEEYLNVWMGFPRTTLEGVVYARQIKSAMAQGRIGVVPWVEDSPVYTSWDLGDRDHTGIWFWQWSGMQMRVIRYYENRQQTVQHYLKYMSELPYNYSTIYLPHDGAHHRLGAVRYSVEDIVRKTYKQVRVQPRLSPAVGINAARQLFGQMWFDEEGCALGLEHLREYRYTVDEHGGYSNTPLHDEHSDCADAFRGMALANRTPTLQTRPFGHNGGPPLDDLQDGPELSGRPGRSGSPQAWMRN